MRFGESDSTRGVSGILSKDQSASGVAAGDSPRDERRDMAGSWPGEDAACRDWAPRLRWLRQELLSARERSVLRGVFEGLSNKEIGQRLSISQGLVKLVLQQLFARTGVRTRSQLVRIAVERHSHDWLREG